MIVYGTKATQIATEKVHNSCSNCGTLNSVQMSVFQKYAHVFWIPFFPIGKTAVTQCSHCKQILEKKQFSESLNNTYQTLKSNSKTPYWTFSGMALVAVLIISLVISDRQKDEKNAKLVLAPQKGDLYEIKNGYEHYTLYKVQNIIGDTVFVFENEFETNKLSGLRDLKNKGDQAFTRESLPLSKAELKSMLDNGTIMDIERE